MNVELVDYARHLFHKKLEDCDYAALIHPTVLLPKDGGDFFGMDTITSARKGYAIT